MGDEGGNNGGAVSIGNYKGVMLCNRPFNGVATTLAREARSGPAMTTGPSVLDNSKAAFLVGNPGEALGMNVPILSEPAHAIKRDKKNTALSKHKKWLHDLQKERARLQAELLEDDAKRRQRKDKFSQREAKRREAVRNNNGDDDDDDDNGDPADSKGLHRPMWALTKQTAEEKLECMEDAEADDLIAFATNLDIDQFMDDVELKAKVAQIEQQLAQVQSIVEYEEAQEKRELLQQRDDGSDFKPAALTGNNLAQLERAMSKQFGGGGGGGGGDDDDDTRSVASSVLSECKSIRSVHSVRSVAALTKRVEAKLGHSESGPPPMTAPRVITIDEEQGARMQIKHNPSNLPYIHRNPAI